MSQVVNFFKEAISELKRVTWPTPKDVINLTLIILASIIMAAIIFGVFDFGMAKLFEFISRR